MSILIEDEQNYKKKLADDERRYLISNLKEIDFTMLSYFSTEKLKMLNEMKIKIYKLNHITDKNKDKDYYNKLTMLGKSPSVEEIIENSYKTHYVKKRYDNSKNTDNLIKVLLLNYLMNFKLKVKRLEYIDSDFKDIIYATEDYNFIFKNHYIHDAIAYQLYESKIMILDIEKKRYIEYRYAVGVDDCFYNLITKNNIHDKKTIDITDNIWAIVGYSLLLGVIIYSISKIVGVFI